MEQQKFSIFIPKEYQDDLKNAFKKIIGETSNSQRGVFIKNENALESFFDEKISQEIKDEIMKTHKKNIEKTMNGQLFLVYDGNFEKVDEEFYVNTLYYWRRSTLQK